MDRRNSVVFVLMMFLFPVLGIIYLFVRFPIPMTILTVIALLINILGGFSLTEPMIRSMGFSTSKTFLINPIQVDWVKDTSHAPTLPDHRAMTVEITNQTDRFFREFTLWCRGDSHGFYVQDQSGMNGGQEHDYRSYRIPSDISVVYRCQFTNGSEGKPSAYLDQGMDITNWGDREPEIRMPEDFN